MSDKLTLPLWEPVQAHKAILAVYARAKPLLMAGHRLVVELRPEKRSDPQNRRMWAMLTEVAKQVDWHGQKLDSEDWKHIFTASLKKQRVAPGIDGGFVVLGTKTSRMTKAEMTELIELIFAFGAQHDVRFADDYEFPPSQL